MPLRTATLVFLLALCLANQAFAASPALPESGAVPGWEREGPLRRFTAADLYGHINGGAELFLELGFVELLVQPYIMDEREISLEIYRMESPLAALAIYLFKCGEETPWAEIDARNSSTRFQAVLLRGDCLVMVNSFSGVKTLRPAMVALAGKLLEAIPSTEAPDPFVLLPAAGRLPGSERLFRGEYSLQSLYTFGPGDVLKLGGELFGAAADYSVHGQEIPETRIRTTYPNGDRARDAFTHLQSVFDPVLTVLEKNGRRLVFRDFAGRFGLARLEGGTIDILVNLPSPPGSAAVSSTVQ